MGEAKQRQTATNRLITEYPRCCLCGGVRASQTREHMPPKALFDGSHRPDKLVMPACTECNDGTRTADLVAAIVSRWGYDMLPHERADHLALIRRAKTQCPEIKAEWTALGPVGRLNARAHLEKMGVTTPPDAGIATLGPLSVQALNLFAYKAVLALYFEAYKLPLLADGKLWATWRRREDFQHSGEPQWLLDILPQYGTLTQGRWDESKTFEYRYDTGSPLGLFGCLARFRRGLYVMGFAAATGHELLAHKAQWIKPDELLATAKEASFTRRS